jgi:putative phosphonate catabolism associated alcohol dehydrogenase
MPNDLPSPPTTSLAAVFEAVGRPFSIRTFPLPELQSGEALVRIGCATICGSDLHSFTGRRPAPVPSVLGHEMIGRIAALGPGGMNTYDDAPLALGDRVTWSMVWSCGQCYYCRHDLRPKCEKLQKFGHEAIGMRGPLFGALAEYCHLPAGTAVFGVPDNLPDNVACPANCATATVAAVFRHAGGCEGKSVVVLGAGMLGLTACAMASHLGAEQVICLEPDPQRRGLARCFGATALLDSVQSVEETRKQIFTLTHGRGADVALDFAGHPQALELGIELLRAGGRFVVAGATFPARPVQWSGEMLVKRLLQVIGVYNYAPEDLGRALEFLAAVQQRFPFAGLVAKTFSLQEVNEAFEYAERQRPPRVAVVP